jgi:hypothetical protein
MIFARQPRPKDSDAQQSWLRELGLRFDPFQYLEASADPRLGDYVVGQEAFAVAWDDAPALVFAPAGGGKTAMRIYATRACWVGLGGAHPFPIAYNLSKHSESDHPPTPTAHLRELARAGARALLIGLAYRPERFLQLEPPERCAVAALLESGLSGSLLRYLTIAREGRGLAELPRRLEPGYRLSSPPSRAALVAVCDALAAALPADVATQAPEEQFEQLVVLLQGRLGFRSVYIMVDALDAFPETLRSPEKAVAWLEWLLEQAAPWAAQRLFVKGFLPSETETAFSSLVTLSPTIRRAKLDWTAPMLADMIRRRVYVASGGEFGSLDAVCGPDVRDVETVLIKALPARARLPREALMLVQRVLIEYSRRPDRIAGRLALEDLDTAIRWYRTQQVRPNAVPDG